MWGLTSIAIWFLAIVGGLSSALENPLNGRHLRVLPVEFSVILNTTRNATGHVIAISGVLPNMLEAISRMLNFSYHYIPGNRVPTFDDTPLSRGGVSYLLNNEVDYLLVAAVGLSYRYQMVDFPASWYNGEFGTLVAYPKGNVNLSASYKPLSKQVWIAVIGYVVIFPLYFRLLSTCNPTEKGKLREMHLTSNNDWARYYFYLLGNLMSQGQYWPTRRLTTRIAAGAWCLACFFLVQIYCSTLVSHLTSPNSKTIINSFFDISKTPGVTLTLDRGLALDQTLKTTNTTFANAVVNMLNNDPSLRCNITSDCLLKVQAGTSAYASPPGTLKQIMAKDVASTGACQYTTLKETFWNTPVFTSVAKKSPYTEHLSRGILRTREAGLIDYWKSLDAPQNDKCSKIYKTNKTPQRLSLNHMGSAFLLLGIGFITSLLTFIAEQMRFFLNKLATVSEIRRN